MVWQAYRRVASKGACSFCLMLASRGAVYSTAENAVAGHSVDASGHDHCNCSAELETDPANKHAIRIDPSDANKIIKSWTKRGKTASYDLAKFKKLGIKAPPKAKVPKAVLPKPRPKPHQRHAVMDVDAGALENPRSVRWVESLDSLPKSLLDRMDRAGVKVRVLKGESVTVDESMAYLKGVVPRGWEGLGMTWDDVPGLFDTHSKKVILGQGKNEGTINMALHEFGHAVDHASGPLKLSNHPEFVKLYSRVRRQLCPHLRQAGDAGREETFAELFAEEFSPEHLAGPSVNLSRGAQDSPEYRALKALIRKLALGGS